MNRTHCVRDSVRGAGFGREMKATPDLLSQVRGRFYVRHVGLEPNNPLRANLAVGDVRSTCRAVVIAS